MHDFRRDFRIASLVLAILSAIATALCYLFGYSGLEAWLFAILGVVCCLVQPRLWACVFNRAYRVALGPIMVGVFIAAGTLASWVDLTSNFQTIVAARGLDVQRGELQTDKHDLTKSSLEERRTLLGKYNAERAAIDRAHPWAATASLAGLQAQITNLEGDYVYARSKQCADVTLASSRRHCDKIADLRDRAGVMAKRNEVTQQIARLQQDIDTRRAELDDTPPGMSRAYMQALGMVAMLSWDGSQPTEVARSNLHKAINIALALALWLLPSLLAIAGYRPTYEPEPASAPSGHAMTPHPHHTAPMGGGNGGGTRHETVTERFGNVPVQITHNVTHSGPETKMAAGERLEPRAARLAAPPQVRPQQQQMRDTRALNVIRVRDTSFARRVASITDHYKATKQVRVAS